MVVKASSSPCALRALGLLLADGAPTVHNVYFVKYDVTVSFMGQVFDFKIGLSLFGCAEKYTLRTAHCALEKEIIRLALGRDPEGHEDDDKQMQSSSVNDVSKTLLNAEEEVVTDTEMEDHHVDLDSELQEAGLEQVEPVDPKLKEKSDEVSTNPEEEEGVVELDVVILEKSGELVR